MFEKDSHMENTTFVDVVPENTLLLENTKYVNKRQEKYEDAGADKNSDRNVDIGNTLFQVLHRSEYLSILFPKLLD